MDCEQNANSAAFVSGQFVSYGESIDKLSINNERSLLLFRTSYSVLSDD